VSEENPRLNCFRVNEDWRYIEMKSYSRIVVVGGKNTGKSTFAQYLINQNIAKFKKILLIDFDIGQPICGVSQTISATIVKAPVIGAGYLNPNLKQAKSFLFGDKSITNAPFKYVACVKLLIDFCRSNEELNNIPWVINTLGYQKGFGIQLLTVILKIVQPSDVVQIQHANVKYNFENIMDENIVNQSKLSFFEEYHIRGIAKVIF
jgi:polynucleotide 5'-hydroxyl-kinase GRC3/NOL9